MRAGIGSWGRRLVGLGIIAAVLLGGPAVRAEEEPEGAADPSPPEQLSVPALHAPTPHFLEDLHPFQIRLAAQPLEESLWRAALPHLVEWLLWQEHLPLETVKTQTRQWLVLNRSLESRSPTASVVWQGLAAVYMLNNERANAANAINRALKLAPDDFYGLLLQVVIGHPGQGPESTDWQWDLNAATRLAQVHPQSALAQYAYAEAMRRHPSSLPESPPSAVFLKAVQLDPDRPLFHLQAGRVLLEGSQPERAAGEFEETVKLTGTDALVLEIIGNVYARQRHYDDAVEYFRRALGADGRNARLYSYLESIYGRQGRWDEVIKLFQGALQFFPGEEEVYDRIALAHRYRRASPAEIAGVYQQATRDNPNNANLFATLGYFRQEAGQVREAMDAYRRAISLNPRFGDAYNSLAALYWRNDEVRPILTLMQDALQKNPDFALGHYWLANAHLRLDQADNAVAAYQKAVALEPNFPEAFNMMGIAYRVKKQEDLAIQQFRKAVQINGRYIDAWMNLGDTYDSLKQFQEATQAYQQVVNLRPYDPGAHFGLGNIYTETGDFGRAAEEFYRTILIHPGDMNARNNLGNVYLKQGQHDRALNEFRRILVINPRYASAYYNIACSFALQNRPEQALPYLTQAIRLDKNLRTLARTDPDLNNIRHDQRFQKLVE